MAAIYHFPVLVGALLLLLALIHPLPVQSRGLKATVSRQSFAFLQHLQGCHKGQNVKGLHQLKRYLEHFGYLHYKTNLTHAKDDDFDDYVESAVKTYQSHYHLNVTGNLDHETVKQMMLPRCGNPDIVDGSSSLAGGKRHHHHNHGGHSNHFHQVSHYSFFDGNPRWPSSKTHLTYTFRSSAPVVQLQLLRSVSVRAFQRWTDVSRFTFEEVPQGAPADIEIGFHRRDHGDGHAFDGILGTLAHAFAPTVGMLHYDADENWSTNPTNQQVDLESVAVHEIGHILGLGHSLVTDAIMFAQFKYGATKRELHADDIQGIRALYT
ncbi:metalloendoproteinase 3-MMP-like [Malania oleifera]|uniref:metalloendoproteinase 3-MMP-like n=1 Tax=Malania oleifera TaxID=397392 RepID=UPI0025AE870E|nr:metalloendoproteinase 3-MMP-like [Malania oleifera]